jgi:hypothetical protein
MDHRHYDKKIISTFNVIGCYFVDVYYNHLYLNAKDKVNMGASKKSLTDEYKNCVVLYTTALCKEDKYYKKTLTGIHEYYQMHTRYSNITLRDFINEFIQQFVPIEYYSIMTETDKNTILTKIITDIVKQFSKEVLKIDSLRRIIDQHSNEINPDILINKIVEIQTVIRENIFHEFVYNNSKDDADTINRDVVDKILNERNILANQVKLILKEKCKVVSELDKAKKIAEYLGSELSSAQHIIQQLEDELESLKNKNVPSNVPQNSRQTVPHNVPQNSPLNVPQNSPHNVPQNSRQTVPINVPQNSRQTVPQNVPQNSRQTVQLNIPQNEKQNEKLLAKERLLQKRLKGNSQNSDQNSRLVGNLDSELEENKEENKEAISDSESDHETSRDSNSNSDSNSENNSEEDNDEILF